MRPEFYAQASVYGDLYGYGKHTLGCYQCKTILHKNEKFNINVAFLNPRVGGGNQKSVKSSNPMRIADQYDYAKTIFAKISQADCWQGLIVVKQEVAYNSFGQFLGSFTQWNPTSHHHFLMQLWAQENMPCARFTAAPGVSDDEYFANLDNYVYEEWPQENEITPVEKFLW